MKTFFTVVLACLLSSFAAMAGDLPPSFEKLPDVVASIGEKKITKADLLEEAKPMLERYRQDPEKAPPDAMWKRFAMDVTDNLVNRAILLMIAEGDGISPSKELTDKVIAGMLNGKPLEEIGKALEAQNISIDDFRKRVGEGAAIQKWVEEKLIPGISVSDQEIETRYRENPKDFRRPAMCGAAHILVKPEPIPQEKLKDMSEKEIQEQMEKKKLAAKAKAGEIYEKLMQGGDFSALAKEFSDCPSGEKGGDLGKFSLGKMVKNFETAAFSQEIGKIGEPVETVYGYHIIKVTSREDESFVPLEQVSGMLKKQIQQDKAEESVMNMIEKKKKERKVKVFID